MSRNVPTCPQCASLNQENAKFCFSCGHCLVLKMTPEPQLQVLWKCHPQSQSDGSFSVDWQGSPTFRVTISAASREHTILHLVPTLTGVGVSVPIGSLLVERIDPSRPLNPYSITREEVVMKYKVIGSKLGTDDAMVVYVQ